MNYSRKILVTKFLVKFGANLVKYWDYGGRRGER